MAIFSNSAAARANAARETTRARMRRILAEDAMRECAMCGGEVGYEGIAIREAGKTIRTCPHCLYVEINLEISRMTNDEILDAIDRGEL